MKQNSVATKTVKTEVLYCSIIHIRPYRESIVRNQNISI